MINHAKGMLVEYALSLPPLALVFDFNPEKLSRTRSIKVSTGNVPGTRGGYDFALPTETPRVSQGVTQDPETISIEILIDGTEKLQTGDAITSTLGIEPQLDTLRTMVEPKSQGPGGLQVLSSLGESGGRAFEHEEHASVLLFVWGTHILPVFLTSVKVDEIAHLPHLVPYRANVTLTMQVIEGNNPFYEVEKIRQVVNAAINLGQTVAGAFSF